LSLERYSDRVLYFVVLLHAIFNSCVKPLSLTLDLYLSIIVSCGVQTCLSYWFNWIQRKFTKRIKSLASVPYSNRLNLLNIQPLELWRLHLDLTNYYKILSGLSPLTATDYFLIYSSIPSTRSDMTSLLKPLHASSKLSSSFFYRSVDAWNHLPLIFNY